MCWLVRLLLVGFVLDVIGVLVVLGGGCCFVVAALRFLVWVCFGVGCLYMIIGSCSLLRMVVLCLFIGGGLEFDLICDLLVVVSCWVCDFGCVCVRIELGCVVWVVDSLLVSGSFLVWLVLVVV